MIELHQKNIILFDGVCNLCAGSVQFILRHDRRKVLLFASLQSEEGREITRHFHISGETSDTFFLVENGVLYRRSTGALRVLKQLGYAWKLLYGLIIVPGFVRDAVYDWIARNRYAWFGKRHECWIPTPELRARFLE